MRETINQLVDIDHNSKKVINDCKEKEDNIENYITIELEKRKSEVSAKYKYKINFLKTECEKEFNKKTEEIKIETQKIIEKIQHEYNKNKEEKIGQIINKILI